jgi:micrococcal nuclease
LIIIVALAALGSASELLDGSDDLRDAPPSDPGLSTTAPETEIDSAGGSTAKQAKKKKATKQTKKKQTKKQSSDTARGPVVLVSRVVDGDTVKVLFQGTEQSVRLIGIDTPETVHPFEPVECFGRAASDFTTSNLEGRQVALEFDVERYDHYDRLLAYVWVGGQLFNRTMVARGFAQVSTYPPNVKYTGRFLTAQRSARQANLGLWDSCPLGGGVAAGGNGSSDTDAQGVAGTSGGCDGYDPCLPPAGDYDCAGGGGNGPKYATGPIKVTGPDPYELDSDGDGLACQD